MSDIERGQPRLSESIVQISHHTLIKMLGAKERVKSEKKISPALKGILLSSPL